MMDCLVNDTEGTNKKLSYYQIVKHWLTLNVQRPLQRFALWLGTDF